nr:ribonuclease H-like domain-containing protein [Tanacetum cinerariifolium]
MKGIMIEFSLARTPQENGVAEKKNRTLIETASTMIADSKLPTTFWAKAVNTACYVQNRVLVIKPHNKTPYELFLGRKLALSFMRPFGCPVTILNTLDHLGKFDGKADEGFFIGYSTHSKAFRVFNIRTKVVEECLHITYLENKPNVVGIRPNWLFDIDTLSMSMNYQPNFVGNQTNGSKNEVANDAEKILKFQERSMEFRIQKKKWEAANTNSTNRLNTISLPVNTINSYFTTVDPGRERAQRNEFKSMSRQDKDTNGNRIFTPVSADGPTYVYLDGSIHVNAATLPNADLPNDLLMPDLEDTTNTGIFSDAYDDEVEDEEANFNNLELITVVSPILTTKIHKDHPKDQIIGDPLSALQTRRMTKTSQEHAMVSYIKKQKRTNHKNYHNYLLACFLSQIEPKKVIQALTDPRWIEEMQDELLQFKLQKMDVKSAFLYGTIEEEVYVCPPPGFKDPHFPNKKMDLEEESKIRLCLSRRTKMSSMGKLTFFLGLQVMQKDDCIFISQDKYVADILKKFEFPSVKIASTLIETNKVLLKDEEAVDVDVYLYRLMIRSLMYLIAFRPDIMFTVCACARFEVTPKVSHLHAVKRIFRYLKGQPKLDLWYPKDSPFDLEAFSNSDYGGSSLERKFTTRGCQFLEMAFVMNLEFKLVVEQRLVLNGCLDWIATTAKIEIQVSAVGLTYYWYILTTARMVTAVGVIYINRMIDLIKVNDDVQIRALIDGKRIIVTEASIGLRLQLQDAKDTACLPNDTIFEELARMSAKNTSWNEFSNTMASTIIYLANNKKFNFSKYILNNMVFANMKREGKSFSGITPLFATMMVQALEDIGEGLEVPTDTHYTPIVTQPSASQPQKNQKSKRKQRKETEVPHIEPQTEESVPIPSNDPLPSGEDRMQLTELMNLYTNLQKQVLDLDKAKTAQAKEIDDLKKRVKKLERKKKSRTSCLKRMYKVGLSARIVSYNEEGLGDQEDASKQGRIAEIDVDENISLIDETAQDQGRMNEKDLFGVNDLDGDKVIVDVTAGEHVEQDATVVKKEVSTTDPVTTTGEVVTTAEDVEVTTAAASPQISKDDVTLAQTLIDIKEAKPKARRAKDKGKGIMIEPKKPLKKDQTALDEEVARKLEAQMKAKIKEKEMIEREKDKANIALIKEWDDVQATIDADKQLAEQLQAQEREQLSIEERSKLLAELIKSRRKYFAAKRAKEIKNKPPIKAQQKRDEIEQESAKRQRLEKEDDTVKLKRCLEIVFEDDDDVTIEATHLSSKSPTIVDYKIYKEGKKSYFKLIRADGNSQNYLTSKKMFKNFIREDLKVLRSIIKTRFKKTKPVNDMDNLLFQTLNSMFDHQVEDNICKYQKGAVKVHNWKLFDSCEVYCVTTHNMVYYLLVEKMHSFTNNILHQMWKDMRLQVYYEVKMAYDLLRLIR